MNEEKASDVKKNRKRLLIVIGVIIVALLIIVVFINKSMCSNVKSAIIGKTFSGTYSYDGSNGSWSIRDKYTVEFIDESTCNITVHYCTESKTSTIDKRDEIVEYKNVTYKVSGGIGGVKLTWDDDNEFLYEGLTSGMEPFYADISGRPYVLLSKEFISYRSLRLEAY